jgi:phosphatidate cytidylyltransferase
MKEIFVRALSGSIYAIAIIGSLLYNQIAFNLILFFFIAFTIFEFQKLVNSKSFIPYIFLTIIWYIFISTNILHADHLNFILFPTLLSHLLLIFWLYSKFDLTKKNYFKTNKEYNPNILMLLYILTWINNTFAYLTGISLGKNQIFKSISPKKSWEGFLGGIFFCFLASYIFIWFKYPLEKKLIISITILVPFLNLFGDLIQSKFKRLAKVKDSGSIIPGHGGVYDRMDSILLTAPWAYLILTINNHVS